jgi:hypothetical protein
MGNKTIGDILTPWLRANRDSDNVSKLAMELYTNDMKCFLPQELIEDCEIQQAEWEVERAQRRLDSLLKRAK